MRKHWMAGIVLLPLFLTCTYAEQDYSVDDNHSWVFPGDEGGTGSYLGVDIADVTADRLSSLKLKEEKGVEVTMVDQDAPAGKAGIKEHDVILSMNGMAVESGAQLRRMIHETPPGRTVTFVLSRDGAPMTVKVQLANKNKEFAFSPKPDIHVNIPEIHVPDIDIPSINMVVVTSSARSGLMVENITPQLGEFFGVRNGNGVLVRSVEKGSRAEKAGFRAGDVVVKVNDQPVHDTSDFTHGVRSRKGNSLSVVVIRDKKEQTLTLSLPDRKDSGDLMEEESFDIEPLMQAESALELTKVQDEVASIKPDLLLAAENSRKTAEKVQQEFRTQQKEFQRQKREFEKNMLKFQRQWQQMQADWL